MKKYLVILTTLYYSAASCQVSGNESVKLYVPKVSIERIGPESSERIEEKLIQSINASGIAYTGYSNFMVTPNFFVNDAHITDYGMKKMWSAKCLFTVRIERSKMKDEDGASYGSRDISLTGIGKDSISAVRDAINKINIGNTVLKDFFTTTKTKIYEYYQSNCYNVISEAEQMYKLNRYDYSIALLFSIPQGTICYDSARTYSIKVYKKYMDNECQKNLRDAKAIMATNQFDSLSMANYDMVLEKISKIDPTTSCYQESLSFIKSIEKSFTEHQKQEYDLMLEVYKNENELEKMRIQNMEKINMMYKLDF